MRSPPSTLTYGGARLVERQVNRYGRVVGDAVAHGVVQALERAPEVRGEEVRLFIVVVFRERGRADENPVELVLADEGDGALHLVGRDETLVASLVRVRQRRLPVADRAP